MLAPFSDAQSTVCFHLLKSNRLTHAHANDGPESERKDESRERLPLDGL